MYDIYDINVRKILQNKEEKMFKHRDLPVTPLMMVLFSAMCLFSLIFCSVSCGNPSTERVENIVLIFMHEPGHYSFAVQLPNSDKAEILEFFFDCKIMFIMDVPENERMWAYIRFSKRHIPYLVDLHIRSINDIVGAGWHHSKGRSGQTHVIR